MLDIRRIRENPDQIRAGLQRRGADPSLLEAVLAADERRREILRETEALRRELNAVSKEIARMKRDGVDTTTQQNEMRRVGDRIATLEQSLRDIESTLRDTLLRVPNLPHASTPDGRSSADNPVVREWGTRRTFPFPPRTHLEIGDRLGLFDFPRGAKISGAGFPVYVGMGARLERALIHFMLDLHTREHGYTEVSPPFVVNTAAMTGTGQLPRMAEDMYRVATDDLWLIPTAEVPVTNLYRDEIIERPLPIKLTAYTPCFRREAGAAGRDTRGLIRVHQFDKVEMVKFVEPERSYEELETLTADAEDVLRRLELPYRVVALCAGDISFAAAKCYDLELWAPGQQAWLEVSSCSNFEDFQARRANIRYRKADGKPEFVHTLNGSGVALARLVVALLENGQQEDGSVVLPEVLAPYLGGLRRLTPPS